MKKAKKFTCRSDYETFSEKFDNCADIEQYPILIENEKEVKADCFIECKSYKTAIKNFFRVFSEVISNEEKENFVAWYETILESCENGYFKIYEKNNFSYEVENLDQNYYYIYLNYTK